MKRAKATNDQLLKDNAALAERLASLEGQFHGAQQDNTLAGLRQQKAEALANQDYVRVAEIDDALLELRLQSVVPKPPKPDTYTPPKEEISLDPEVEKQIIKWRDETGPDGEVLRPWVKHGHPAFEKALHIASAVEKDPDVDPADWSEKMRRIDAFMGVKPPAPKPVPVQAKPVSFFSSETPPRAETPAVVLTAEQMYIARKMFPGNQPQAAYDRYKKSVLKHGRR